METTMTENTATGTAVVVTEAVQTKGSVRELRHLIANALVDFDIADEVAGLLAGRGGLSYGEQRDNVLQAQALIQKRIDGNNDAEAHAKLDEDDAEALNKAVGAAGTILAIIAEREEANKPKPEDAVKDAARRANRAGDRLIAALAEVEAAKVAAETAKNALGEALALLQVEADEKGLNIDLTEVGDDEPQAKGDQDDEGDEG
jgi:hypothetical protein